VTVSSDSPLFLFAGDSSDVPYVQATLERLPVDAFGHVFLEVATSIQIQSLRRPEGMSVHWLCRTDVGVDATMSPRGARLEAATRAWLSEWMCGSDSGPRIIWIGATTIPAMSRLHDEIHHHHAG
tara:strand:- start:919 stop:1293 length:375 start_codon:yes stop_codon:yes gene_type:complete